MYPNNEHKIIKIFEEKKNNRVGVTVHNGLILYIAKNWTI